MPSLEEVLRQEARLVAPPGSGFAYSNPGFNLLELLVQDVTGRDFGAYMEERILRPLGMVDAVYGWNASLASRIPVGHDLAGRTVEPYTYPERGAGGLLATVEDMARFLAAGMPGPSEAGVGCWRRLRFASSTPSKRPASASTASWPMDTAWATSSRNSPAGANRGLPRRPGPRVDDPHARVPGLG
jgi:CubicO group peptidase (beta-lactamase class C family)